MNGRTNLWVILRRTVKRVGLYSHLHLPRHTVLTSNCASFLSINGNDALPLNLKTYGLSVWLVRRSGIPYRRACGIQLLAGTVLDNLWRRFCSQHRVCDTAEWQYWRERISREKILRGRLFTSKMFPKAICITGRPKKSPTRQCVM